MNLLSWILFGAIVGIITNSLDHSTTSGIPNALILGIIGAVTGGLLASVLFGGQYQRFDLTSFLIAAGGSLFLLTIGRALKSS